MTVRNPRSRMISVRLSEEEYLGLKRLCAITRARSVSELTRDAMRVVLNGLNRDNDNLGLGLHEIHGALKNLDHKIDQLSERIVRRKSDESSS